VDESERHVRKGKGREGQGRAGQGRTGRVLAPPRSLAGAGWKEAYAGSVGGLSIESKIKSKKKKKKKKTKCKTK